MIRNSSGGETCFLLIDACERYSQLREIDELRKAIVIKIASEFETLSELPHFSKFPFEYFKSMLQGNQMLSSEGALFKAVVKWVEADKENRMVHFDDLFNELRIPLLEADVL